MHAGFDGCVLEISTDGEEPWTDLGTRITYGGYTHRISEDYNSPIAGRMAWSGTSGPSLTRVEVDLDDFAGNDATLRYRLVCDTTAILPDSGWTDGRQTSGPRLSHPPVGAWPCPTVPG